MSNAPTMPMKHAQDAPARQSLSDEEGGAEHVATGVSEAMTLK
jgi:hypothetical protein